MMTIIRTQNINPDNNLSHLTDINPRKRKRYGSNATRKMNSLYPREWDEEDDDSIETLEFEYCDVMGRPYLDTLVRPESILQEIIANLAREKKEAELIEFKEIMSLDPSIFTSLTNPDESCPESYLKEFGDWDEAISAYRNDLSKKCMDECMDECTREFDEADMKNKELCKKVEMERLLASLPRFSKAMLARMKKAEEENERNKVVRASSTFYTTKSNTTQGSNVFGHRRSGGGKKGRQAKNARLVAKVGTISLSSIRDEKYKELITLTDEVAKQERKVRRQNTKARNEEEDEKRSIITSEIMRRVELARDNTPPPIVEVVEETEWQKFKRNELNDAIKQQKIVLESSPLKYTEFVSTTVERVSSKPTQQKTKTEILQDELTRSLYRDSVRRKDPVTRVVTCTRLCRSFTNGGACPHRDKCMFAHSLNEYNPIVCSFGVRCRNTTCKDGSWENTGGRVCTFIHPNEDKAKYCTRIGTSVIRRPSTQHQGSSRPPSTQHQGSSRPPSTQYQGSSRQPSTQQRVKSRY